MSPRTRASGAGSVPERRDVYERLADELRQGIVSGRYKPGDRLPSTLELMERTGVANLTVRGAYRVLIEEGLVESVSKRGFYVRRPNAMTWRMNPARNGRRAGSASPLDGWAADVEAAGLAHREEISVAIEDSSVLVLGTPVGERLGCPEDRGCWSGALSATPGPPARHARATRTPWPTSTTPTTWSATPPLASPGPADPVGGPRRDRAQAARARRRTAAPAGHHRRTPAAQPAAGLGRAGTGPHRAHRRPHAGGRAAPDPPWRRRHLHLRDQLPRPVTTGPC